MSMENRKSSTKNKRRSEVLIEEKKKADKKLKLNSKPNSKQNSKSSVTAGKIPLLKKKNTPAPGITPEEQEAMDALIKKEKLAKAKEDNDIREYRYQKKAAKRGMTARELKRSEEKFGKSLSIFSLRLAVILALVLIAGVLGAVTVHNVIKPNEIKLELPFSKLNSVFGFGKAELTGSYAESWADKLVVCNEDVGTDTLSLSSGAALLFDIDKQEVVYAKGVHQKRSPASITKIMTALCALKYGNLDDVVNVTNSAYNVESGSSVCDIKPGDVLTMKQLVYGMMVASGNDAAMMIAEHVSGSVSDFIDLMNQEAQAIGATETHFMNPHGLTNEDHYTSAYDIYLIFQEALKYDPFEDIISRKNYYAEYTHADGTPVAVTWDATNHYFTGEATPPEGVYVYGGKTGTTSDAGACLALKVKDCYGHSYIAVILHAETKEVLYDEMTQMLGLIAERE